MVRIDSEGGTKSKPVPKKLKEKNQNKSKNDLKKTTGGRIEKGKSKRPMSKTFMQMNRDARKALATGEIASQEIKQKIERDLRTMYIRFKHADERPVTEEDIRAICPSVVFVRTPRQAKKKVANNIKFAYLEFDSEASCVKAVAELSKSGDKYFVDFVGEKSRNVKSTEKTEANKRRPINPTRLFVSNLPAGMTVDKLKQLFPKCSEAQVTTKGSLVGFVQFSNAGDAKSAFDAAQNLCKSDLPAGVPKLTVLYARMAKRQSTLQRDERKKSKLTEQEEEVKEESDDDDGDGEEEVKEESDDGDEEETAQAEEGSDIENDEDSEAEGKEEQAGEDAGEEEAEEEEEDDEDVANDEDTDDDDEA